MDVSQYLGIFLDESKEHIQSLSDQMMILEQEPENQDAINEILEQPILLKEWLVPWDISGFSG